MVPKDDVTASWPLFEADCKASDGVTTLNPTAEKKRKWEILWINVFIFSLLHIGAIYGVYLFVFRAMWKTGLLALFLHLFSGPGITAGAHRLWSHKAYEARLPLRILLIIANTLAYENSVIQWARDHRVHHKFSETDADPHNATRGFFFSHIGWLLVKKHPSIREKGPTIDISDLLADPVLRFQKKYYMILVLLICFVIPTYIPTLWSETAWNAFFTCGLFRYVLGLHMSWCINSVAHSWGSKPYDQNIGPVETKPLFSILAFGEGFHNYHHTYPWDYKAAELGDYSLNFTTLFIDCMAKIGWAYDLKTVSPHVIQQRVKRTGDGSHPVWGWDDKDVSLEDKKVAIFVNPAKDQRSTKVEEADQLYRPHLE